MPAAESYPDDLRYHREHDWARVDGETATFGVTWYAQDALGDLVVYLPPEEGATIAARRRVRRARVGQGRVRHRRSRLGHRDRGQPGRDRRARARQRRSLRAGLADQGAALRPSGSTTARCDGLLDAAAYSAPHRGPLERCTEHGCPSSSARCPSRAATSGPRPRIRQRMLALLGHDSLDELARAAVPASILLGSDLDLPEALPEIDVLAELRELGHRNRVMTTMIGLGYYGTHTPQVVLRKVLENPAWYTAYTPYQPEISQGRLEALLNYQTMVCDLTGLPLANSSLLDEATAAAEAMTVARRASKAASEPLRGRPRHLPADARDAADARRAARDRDRPGRPRSRPRRPAAASARSPSTRARAAACATSRRSPRRRTPRARCSASPPTCSRSCCSSRPARWAPTSSSAPRSASASRSASAARTPPT